VHNGPTPAQIAAAAHAAALKSAGEHHDEEALLAVPGQDEPVVEVHEAADQDALVSLPATEALGAAELPEEPAAPAEHPFPAAESSAAEEPEEPTEQPAAAPAPAAHAPAAPKRRKRGRVVAPAGPPRPLGEDTVGATVQAAPTS
jgi:ribonuclease E